MVRENNDAFFMNYQLLKLYYISMNDVKLSLTVILPGRVPVSGEESPVNSYEESVQVYNEVSKRLEKVKIRMKKRKPAQQHLNICSEAYKEMISNSTPYGFEGTSFQWKKMKKNDKLIWHLQEIAKSLGGELMSYHLFDD